MVLVIISIILFKMIIDLEKLGIILIINLKNIFVYVIREMVENVFVWIDIEYNDFIDISRI